MTWNGIKSSPLSVVMAAIEAISTEARSLGKPDWLPESAAFFKSPPLNAPKNRRLLEGLLLWIRTARAAGYRRGRGPDHPWLPSDIDVVKSALFERIGSGKAPLPEPPPVSFACPWYALVEEPGPHFLGHHMTVERVEGQDQDEFVSFGYMSFRLIERRSDTEFVVCDRYHDTSYRFRLRFVIDWLHPTTSKPGGWFLQNLAFDEWTDPT
jgi:hypothetical protein